MKAINSKQGRGQKFRFSRWQKYGLWAGSGLVAVLLSANGIMWLAYRTKVLPNVSLSAVPVGNIAYDDLDKKVEISRLLPSEVTLTKDDRTRTITPVAAGVVVDWPVSRERLKQQRSWFPLLNLLKHRTVPLELTVDQPVFEATQAKLAADFSKEPVQERIIFSGQDFAVTPSEAGYSLDQPAFKSQMLTTLKDGKTTIAVPTQIVEADPPGGLDGDLQSLRKKLAVKIKFNLSGQITQPSAADIGSWFVPSGRTMAISSEKIESYISKLKTGIFNVGNAAQAAMYALDKNTDTTIVLAPTQQLKKYTYCAAAKGVDNSHLPGFTAKVAAVLGDPRGWTASGKIAFAQVGSNCDFSLWLSAPSQMTSFGGACDAYYSCRSGRNVVINFDRWQGATDPWNAAGGSLEDYRVMVTNHEVGHWLGFGHATCPGAGQSAPVMMQQSISLGGCKFNPWPVTSEIAKVK